MRRAGGIFLFCGARGEGEREREPRERERGGVSE